MRTRVAFTSATKPFDIEERPQKHLGLNCYLWLLRSSVAPTPRSAPDKSVGFPNKTQDPPSNQTPGDVED